MRRSFIGHPDFEQPQKRKTLLAEAMGSATAARSPAEAAAPKGVAPHLAHLYRTPLLVPEDEQRLFRDMNYLKYRAWKLRDTQRCRADRRRRLQRDRLLRAATVIRNRIVTANLRLVVSIAKRYARCYGAGFDDLVSEGNAVLIRAAERFDVSRGNRFSTYATWAIRNAMSHAVARQRRDQWQVHGSDELLALHADRIESPADGDNGEELRAALRCILARLDEREHTVIAARFGLVAEGRGLTLEAIGTQMGVSKERIRQIETQALGKLRRAALAEHRSLFEAAG